MFNALLENLTNIGWAMLDLSCVHTWQTSPFFPCGITSKSGRKTSTAKKLIASGLKILVFVVGLTLLCTAITALPIFANEVGWAIPDEYTDIFADLVIIGAVLLVSCKYIKEAFTKFVAILNTGSVENVENVSEPEEPTPERSRSASWPEMEGTKMSNSKLVNYTRISPNKNSPRNHAIDTITIHCVVGQCSVETLGNVFAPTSRQASSNYGIGYDGKIGMYVEEKDRSWCSSSASNDNRAITIEVASDTKHPYAVNEKAFAALLDLVTDICKRNGIKRLVWSTNKKDRMNHLNGCNMTVHRDYANKACPGDYLYNRHGEIAAEVNRRLGASAERPAENKPATGEVIHTVKAGETLSKIAQKYGTTYQKIAAYNRIANANLIRVGQKIKIPADTQAAQSFKKGDKVKVLKAVTYTGKAFKTYYDKYDVIEAAGDRVVIGIGKTVTAAVNAANLKKA